MLKQSILQCVVALNGDFASYPKVRDGPMATQAKHKKKRTGETYSLL